MRAPAAIADSRELRKRVAELETRLEHAQSVIDRLTDNEFRQIELCALMTDAVYIEQDGRVVFANLAAAELHGFDSPAAMVGVDGAVLIHPEDMGRVRMYRSAPPEARRAIPVGRRGLRRDGSVFLGEARASTISWENQPATLVIVRDITERKRAEQQIAEKSALFATTLEIMGHGYCVFGADARLVGFNRKFVEVHRFSPGFIQIGMSYEEIIREVARKGDLGEGDIESLVRERVESIEAGERRTNELTVPNGSTYLYQRRPMPHGGFVATFTDITERKRAEQAVRESEARYRGLIEDSILPIQISTVDRSFLYVNRAYLELLGYDSAEEFFARRARVIAPHDRDRIIAMAEARRRGEAVPDVYEYDAVRKDGTIVPMQSFSRRIVWEGREAYHRTLIDLTERKRAEAQLRQAQKMEAVGQLTGGIAHDFNNLLTVVKGNLEMIAGLTSEPQTRRMALIALKGTKRGADLAHRLLAFSREQTLVPEAVRPGTLVAGMHDLMRRTLGETVDIVLETEEGLWNCTADPGQLENAILNLAINARDAMPGGGTLTIRTANGDLTNGDTAAHHGVAAGEYVMLSVADTGIGMSPEQCEHAFEPFFTTKTIGAGSGLGLSMVHGFISQSRGFVTIDSAPGAGTTVTMYLPKTLEDTELEMPDRSAKSPAAQGERVLIVEDDADVRAFTVTLLSDLGYRTLEAGNGEQAVEILGNTPDIDLLFTDVVLPDGMSGMDVAEAAASLVPGIKTLFTSGYADDVLAKHRESRATLRLIDKPFEIDELARDVRAVLDAEASLSR